MTDRRPERKKHRRGRRHVTPLGVVLLAMLGVSVAVLGMGAYRLLAVEAGMDDGAAAVRSELVARGGGVSAVPSAAAVEQTPGDAVGLLTFFGKMRTEVPVYYGTEAAVLEKGAGQAEGTAALNCPGNAVLFGHRDSAFRALADLSEGDALTLETAAGCADYMVRRIYITDPEDPHIYDETAETVLTLVTCYPFSFVGPAPERCVVVAEKTGEAATAKQAVENDGA